jgi:hypothetical protein
MGLLGVASRLGDRGPSAAPGSGFGEVVDELDRLLQPIRPRAPLQIAKMCFCTRIKTYGVYEPLSDRAQFRCDDQVQVYVELRNFITTAVKNSSGDPRHQIRMRSSYEIHDETRAVVFSDTFHRDGEAADESRTPRHDYFENYTFLVPKLKPGNYTLWIKVEDLGSDPPRSVKGSLDFYLTPFPSKGSAG